MKTAMRIMRISKDMMTPTVPPVPSDACLPVPVNKQTNKNNMISLMTHKIPDFCKNVFKGMTPDKQHHPHDN